MSALLPQRAASTLVTPLLTKIANSSIIILTTATASPSTPTSSYDHYEARNGQRPEQSTARNISSSEVEISLYDDQGELLDVYTVSMLYADGFNSANDYIILTDPSWVEVKYGDVDGDGSIDSTDASQVLVIYAANQTGEPMELTDRESSAADINMDGFIDASDASTILAYYSYTQTGGTKDIFEFIYTIM